MNGFTVLHYGDIDNFKTVVKPGQLTLPKPWGSVHTVSVGSHYAFLGAVHASIGPLQVCRHDTKYNRRHCKLKYLILLLWGIYIFSNSKESMSWTSASGAVIDETVLN